MKSEKENQVLSMENMVALVTGASRGIGQRIAEALAREKVVLFLTEHSQSLNETEKLVSPFTEYHVLKGDVSSSDFARGCMEKIIEKKGKLDILVNAAGITKDALVLRTKLQDLQQVFQVNFFGPVHLMKEALRPMLKARYGRILNIGSVSGIRANIGQSVYGASKAALEAFSRVAAKELASRNITVNVIAPGFIKTQMTEKLTPLQKENVLQYIPMGRFGETADVAALAVFLCSPQAAYITGQTFIVDGGLTL